MTNNIKKILKIFLFLFFCTTFFLLEIALFCHPSSYFHRKTQDGIPIASQKEIDKLKEDWFRTKPSKLKKHNINVFDKDDIKEILKLLDIENVYVDYDFKGYNSYNKKELNNKFKSPPKELLCAYFKPRINHSFKFIYPNNNDTYTLEELLKYENSIEEAFIFWDANQKTKDVECKIVLVELEISTHSDNDKDKIDKIRKYLMENNIIKKQINIELNSYNCSTDTGIISKFTLINNKKHKKNKKISLSKGKTYIDYFIEAIYFDDGYRFIKPVNHKQNIENLLKISNGAKNVYLFTFV